MAKLFDLELVFKQIPKILKYLPETLELAVISLVIGLVLGLIIALVKIKKVPVLSQLFSVYISVLRGTPIIVQLYITYFGIPIILRYINYYQGTNYNINGIPPMIFAIVALGLNQSAHDAETIRAALLSVDKGQIEAAHSLGMTGFQTLKRIILPEAITVALPSLGNSIIALIKGTSLAFACSVIEMTAQAKILAGRNYRYFEAYISLAIVYWLITIIVERIIKFLEKRTSIPDKVDEKAFIKWKGALEQNDRD